MNLKELYWAAGFLEGEGCFHDGKSSSGICVTASQLQRSPLDRLQQLFSGNIHNTTKTAKGKVINTRTMTGTNAAAIMMTLFSLMSLKRQTAIKQALQRWKLQKPSSRGHKTCIYNHAEENIYFNPSGKRICRVCMRQRYFRWKSNKPEKDALMHKGSDTPHGNF